MTDADLKKFAHDVRGPVHSAKLNLEAAQMLAGRISGKDGERLARHLQIIQAELDKLETVVSGFSKKLS